MSHLGLRLITQKKMVVFPDEVLNKIEAKPGDMIQFLNENGKVFIKKVSVRDIR